LILQDHGPEWEHSEKPAIEQLIKMGYEYKNRDELDSERDSYSEVVLLGRIEDAIRKLNSWIDDEGVQEAIQKLLKFDTTITIETNEQIRAKLVGLSRGNLEPITVIQDRGSGPKPYTVRLFDFDNLENNNFLVTNQFELWGHKDTIFPDVMIFVNGIPLVVIECKSPTLTNPLEEAISDNLARYQERNSGFEKLFFYNQIIVATCGTQARYATINAKSVNYKEWVEAYPFTEKDIETQIGWKPRKQEILFAGMFTKSHLLDLMRDFIVYETEGNARIKKLAKYQQFRAVKKAIEVIKNSKSKERGGVIWHTQGSGKSLTMLWLALKIKREFDNPTILFVTDRLQLDRQIHDTFQTCGFPNPIRAKDTDNLETMLKSGKGQTIMTTLFKFDFGEETPKAVSNDSNIFIMVDEAHRSQYRFSHANMRAALPNACYLGFTGTPIDKKERSTRRIFGNYIDTYTIQQSETDGATLPIFYEGRMPDLFVEGDSLDEIFNRVFKDNTEEERQKIKKRYATPTAIASASNRIKKICLDILEHYEKVIRPNDMKAMIVAASREAAVAYKEELDKLNAPESKIIMTSEPRDPKEWEKYELSSSDREIWAERFKSSIEDEGLSILIVVDMLLTGFDAPVLQVLYLDRGIKEHNLLQAIARVNRPYDKKDYGLIVDYWGITKELEKALEVFDQQDVEGIIKPLSGELNNLVLRHQNVMKHFESIDTTNWQTDRFVLEKCVDMLEPDDIRIQFEYDFKQFSKALDMVLPSPKANPYRVDMRFLGVVRAMARTKYHDENLGFVGVGQKVRDLIEEHIKALKIKQLIPPTKISNENFLGYATSWTSDRSKASAIEHKLKHEISEKLQQDPEFFQSLQDRLEKLIAEIKAKRISEAEALKEYIHLWQDFMGAEQKAKEMGFEINPRLQFAFYNKLKSDFDPDVSKQLTHKLYSVIEPLLVIDWKKKDDIQRQMRKAIKDILRENKCEEKKVNPLTIKLVDLVRFNIE
jgi:type I restriction enzyme R subunit